MTNLLDVIGYGEAISDTENWTTDLDNHRIRANFTAGDGRLVQLEAGYIQNYMREYRYSKYYPYKHTGVVLSAHYMDDNYSKVEEFTPVSLHYFGLRAHNPNGYFPYNQQGFIEIINKNFDTSFKSIILKKPF